MKTLPLLAIAVLLCGCRPEALPCSGKFGPPAIPAELRPGEGFSLVMYECVGWIGSRTRSNQWLNIRHFDSFDQCQGFKAATAITYQPGASGLVTLACITSTSDRTFEAWQAFAKARRGVI